MPSYQLLRRPVGEGGFLVVAIAAGSLPANSLPQGETRREVGGEVGRGRGQRFNRAMRCRGTSLAISVCTAPTDAPHECLPTRSTSACRLPLTHAQPIDSHLFTHLYGEVENGMLSMKNRVRWGFEWIYGGGTGYGGAKRGWDNKESQRRSWMQGPSTIQDLNCGGWGMKLYRDNSLCNCAAVPPNQQTFALQLQSISCACRELNNGKALCSQSKFPNKQ